MVEETTTGPDQAVIDKLTDVPKNGGGVDLNSEIRLGQGRTATIAELLEGYRKAESLEQEKTKLEQFRDNAKTLLTSDNLGEVEKGAREVYSTLGMSPDQIEQEVAYLKQHADGTAGDQTTQQKQQQPEQPQPAQGKEAEKMAQDDPRLERLMAATRQQLTNQTKSQIRDAVRNSDKVRKVTEWMKQQGENGEERANKLMERLENEAYRQTLSKFNAQTAKTGEPDLDTLGNMASESASAAQEDLDLFYGDVASLGRSAEDVQAEAARRELLDREPVKLDVNEANEPGHADQKVTDFFTDTIQREVADMESEEAGTAV